MARGRKPLPEGVREQKAAVRSQRRPQTVQPAAVVASGARLAPPSWLAGEGLGIWERMAPTLSQAKLLSEADVPAFGRYCRNFADWLKLRRQMDDEGSTYETVTYGADEAKDKKVTTLKRAHPAFIIADRLERQLLAAEDRFGLNPVERQRIFAARAQTGISGDLFDVGPAKAAEAARATAPAQPVQGPIGMLN